jgi:acyl-CoA hydrolase
MVVTEFGVANLRGKSIPERAEALIQLAHPKFRAELEQQAKEMGYL